MKIENNDYKDFEHFDDIAVGECFKDARDDDYIYLKIISTNENSPFTAFNLTTNNLSYFAENDNVVPLQTKLIIERRG